MPQMLNIKYRTNWYTSFPYLFGYLSRRCPTWHEASNWCSICNVSFFQGVTISCSRRYHASQTSLYIPLFDFSLLYNTLSALLSTSLRNYHVLFLGLTRLTNLKKGDYYGQAASWKVKKKRQLGIHLLKKALQIFLVEGEKQIKEADI